MLAREREGDGFVIQGPSEGIGSDTSINRVHRSVGRLRRLAPITLYLIVLLVLTMESGPNAVEVPPAASPFFLRTHGAAVSLDNGDWYSNSGQGNGYHYVTITIPCDWPSGTPVHVDLFSPSINSGIPGGLDDESGTADSTQFELYASGTTVGPPPAWGTPGPLAAGSLTQTTYLPEGGDVWVRFATITPGACTGVREPWVVRSAVLAPGDDETGWRIRVGRDGDADPTNAPPANYDNFDGVAGTNDEVLIGLVQALYMQTSGGSQCFDLFEYVPPGQTSTTVHNFDYSDGAASIEYFPPSGSPSIVGTEGGNGSWNGGTASTRGGQTLATTESGWWRTDTCLGNNNQAIQEGQTGVAHYLAQPPTPAITTSKTNAVTQVAPGQVVTYTVTASNASGGSSPGAANEVVFTDTLPAETTFQSCDFVAPASGSCTHSGGVVTATMTGALDAGSSADLTITVRVNDLTSGTAANTVSVDYEDSLGNSFPAATASDSDPIVNTAPNAVDDVATTFRGSSVTVTVLANDTDAESNIDASSVTVTVDPANGTATDNPDGTITYAPDSSFTGIDTFTYEVCDFGGLCDSAVVTIAVEPAADLSITKLDTPDPVLAGNNVTYTVTVTNAGPSEATSFTVTDTVPSGLSFRDADSSATCDESGGVVTCTFSGALAPTASQQFTLVFGVSPSAADGSTITNTAVISASAPDDPNSANNEATATTEVDTSADLSITKAGAPDPVIAGENVTYTVTVTNAGPSDAANTVVSDPLPAGTTFESASNSGTHFPATNTVVWNLGTFTESQDPVELTLVLKVNSSQTANLSNTVTVTATTSDPAPANNSATETTPVDEEADLSITKLDTPDPVIAGENVTYTVTVDHAGPSDAANTVVSDPLPSGTTFVTATVGGNYFPATNTVVWDLGTFTESQDPVELTLVLKVNSSQTANLSNTVTVTATTSDPAPANNSDTETTQVDEEADLSITKLDTPDPVLAGNNVTYTVTVDHAGPSDAANTLVSDPLPSGTTFVTATVGGNYFPATNTVVWDLGTFTESQDPQVLTLVLKVNSSQTANLSNTVTVTATTSDPATTNNSATETTVVNEEADLSITKVDDPEPVLAGTNVTYTVTVDNLGPSDSTSFTVTDTVAAGVDIVSVSPACTFSGSVGAGWLVTCTNSSSFSPTDPPKSFTIVARVESSMPDDAQLLNNAFVTAASPLDPNLSNNSASTVTDVDTEADLSVLKSDSPDPLIAGTNLTYTLTIDNAGPSDALSVVVSDPLPGGTTFVSATGGGTYFPATNTVVWNLGTFTEAKPPMTLTFTVKVNSSQTADLSNTASVTSTTTDPNPANNSDTEVTVVNESAALSIVKVDSPDPVPAGTNVTYTVTVTNAGPSDATSVAVSDPIPAGTSFVSASAGGSLVTGTVTWDLGSVAAGETRILTLVVRVDPARTTPISNTATVSSVTPDPNQGNNSDTESTSVITSADLRVVKVDDPDPVLVEGTVTYTVTVTNLGPSDALNVTMEDTLPAGLTFTSISPATGCTETSGTLTCDVGTLATGASTSWTIVASVGKVGGPIFDQAGLINHAETSSTTPDPVLTNNQVDQETTVSAPNVTLVKSADPSSGSELSPGDPITYTITYTNLGSVAATNFVVSDTVSEFFGDVVPSPPGTFDPVTRVITWNIGVIEAAGGPADSGSVTFTARVGSTTSRREIRNMAIGTADEYAGPIESNETRHDLVPPDVLITKRAGQAENSEVRALEVVTYQLAIRNRGSGRASGVVVTDDPPPFMNYVPGSTQLDGVTVPDSGGTSVLFGSGVVMDINRNSTRVVSFRMQVDVAAPPGTLLQNWGFASWNFGREVSADFFDLRVTTPRSGPRLRQSVLVVGPSGETFFVTIFNEIIGILPFTGYQTFVILILGLAAFGFGGSLSSRIVPDLLRRRNDE